MVTTLQPSVLKAPLAAEYVSCMAQCHILRSGSDCSTHGRSLQSTMLILGQFAA